MEKKLYELTQEESVAICKKYRKCLECPLRSETPLVEAVHCFGRVIYIIQNHKDMFEKKVEVDDINELTK